MEKKVALWIILLVAFGCLTCSRKSVSSLQQKGIHVARKALNIDTHTGAGEQIQIMYTGCGGLVIRRTTQQQTILIDPFFSHQSFMTIGKSLFAGGKIRSKPKQVALGKKRILDSLQISADEFRRETQAILAAHGHYDHLMDIPFLYQHWFDQQPGVFVNHSSFNTISHVIQKEDLHDVDTMVSIRESQGMSIDLPARDGSVLKVYPILAAHNPHTKNIKLFSGSLMKTPARYRDPADKTSVHDWLEGRTMSFLVDVERDSTIVFRMFIQSSSCHYPDGMPPEKLLSEKNVDVAVFGIASYHFSQDSYPCHYIGNMRPQHVMFIHWEDFFRKYHRKPKTVMKNDIPKFFKAVLPACNNGQYILPMPGLVVNVKY